MFFGLLFSGYSDILPIPALWFNPTVDPNRLLVISLILGVAQLYLGFIIQGIIRLRAGKPGEALRN